MKGTGRSLQLRHLNECSQRSEQTSSFSIWIRFSHRPASDVPNSESVIAAEDLNSNAGLQLWIDHLRDSLAPISEDFDNRPIEKDI